MYNKRLFSKTNDKKLLHKVGKQWVTVSIAMLMLIGGGAVVSHATHAATNAPKATSVANQPAQKANNQSKQVSSSAIQSSAFNLHQALLNNSVKSNAKPSNDAPIHQTAKPNSAYANYLKQMGGQSTYNNLMNNEAKSANNSKQINRSTNNKQLGSDNDSQRGVILPTYCGLHYKYNSSDQSVEFTKGTLDKSDLSNFLQSADFGATEDYGGTDVPVKSVKFDNDINTSKAKDMSNMFYLCHDLQSVDFGNNFDTSNVTNMKDMFAGDTSLQSVNFGNKFNTKSVTNMSDMFPASVQQIIINSSDTVIQPSALKSLSLFKTTNQQGSTYKLSDANKLNGGGTYVATSELPQNSTITGSYDGLTYNYNITSQSIEFTNGKFNTNNASDFFLNEDLGGTSTNSPIKSVVFGKDVNLNNANTDNMFSGCSQLQSITINSSNSNFGNNVPNPSDNNNNPLALNAHFYAKNNSGYNLTKDLGNNNTFIIASLIPKGDTINGQYHGLDYNYNPINQSLVFTKGTISDSNLSNFLENSDLGYSNYSSPIKSVTFDDNIDTHNVSDISDMFNNAPNLQSVRFSNKFDTSKITNMSNIFGYNTNINKITISSPKTKFNNTASIPMMYIINNKDNRYQINDFFKGNTGTSYVLPALPSDVQLQGTYDGLNYIYRAKDKSLEFKNGTVNVSSTSNFLNQPQFGGNNSTSYNMNLLHVKFDNNVNISKVTDMSNMFAKDDSLESLSLPNSFNTSNVTNMSDMFLDDAELQSLSLPDSFNTNNVTNMNGMFFGDISLNTLKLPGAFVTNRNNNESGNVSTNAMFAGDAELNQLTLPDNLYLNSDMIKLANDTNPGSDGLIWTQVNMIHGTKDAMAIRTKLANELANSNTISLMFSSQGYNANSTYVNIDPYASYQRLIDPYDSPYVVDPLGWSMATNSNIKDFALQNINGNGSISSDMKQYFSDKYLSPFPVSNISFYKQNSDGYTNSYPTNILQLFNGGAHPGTWVRTPNTESDAQISSLSNARTSLSNKVASDERAIASASGTISSDNTKLANDERNLKSDATSLANAKASLSANNSWISSNSASLSNASKEAYSASTSANVITNNVSSLSNSTNTNYETVTTNMNSKATSLSNATTALSSSANSGIQSNSTAITNLSSTLDKASKAIQSNTNSINNLSTSTNKGLDNAKSQISSNKNNAGKAINNINRMLNGSTKTNNNKLAKDIKTINNALTTKEDKTDFGNTVSEIHDLINAKADNAKITNDERQLQNAISDNSNNTGGKTTVRTVETGTNDARIEAKLQELQNDLANHPTSYKHLTGKSLYILVKKPILIHRIAKAIGSKKDSVGIIKPSQHTMIHVIGMKNGHYVINYTGHHYFITANHKYVKNAYYQKHDLKKNNYIKIIRPAGEYRKSNYTKYNQRGRITTWNAGTVMPIRSLQILGNNDVTRFKLVNGHYITANKLFVKLI